MFLKRLERRKNGKRHTYWALVESVRTAGTSRHRVVAYLGALGPREQSGWAHLARRLDRKDRPQPSLFDPPPLDGPSAAEPVLVNLKGVRLQRLRDFGDVWLRPSSWSRCSRKRVGTCRRDSVRPSRRRPLPARRSKTLRLGTGDWPTCAERCPARATWGRLLG